MRHIRVWHIAQQGMGWCLYCEQEVHGSAGLLASAKGSLVVRGGSRREFTAGVHHWLALMMMSLMF